MGQLLLRLWQGPLRIFLFQREAETPGIRTSHHNEHLLERRGLGEQG